MVAVLLSGTVKFTVPFARVTPEGGVTGPRLFVAEKVQPTPGLVVPSRLRICLTTVTVPLARLRGDGDERVLEGIPVGDEVVGVPRRSRDVLEALHGGAGGVGDPDRDDPGAGAFTALADVMAALTVVSSVEVPLPLLFGPQVVGSPSVMKSTAL